MAKKSGIRRVYRSAITGRFIKRQTAKTHPKTTVTETIRVTKRHRKGK